MIYQEEFQLTNREIDEKANISNQCRDLLDTVLTNSETERIRKLSDGNVLFDFSSDGSTENLEDILSSYVKVEEDGKFYASEEYDGTLISPRVWRVEPNGELQYFEVLDGMDEPLLFKANLEDYDRFKQMMSILGKRARLDLKNSFGTQEFAEQPAY